MEKGRCVGVKGRKIRKRKASKCIEMKTGGGCTVIHGKWSEEKKKILLISLLFSQRIRRSF